MASQAPQQRQSNRQETSKGRLPFYTDLLCSCVHLRKRRWKPFGLEQETNSSVANIIIIIIIKDHFLLSVYTER